MLYVEIRCSHANESNRWVEAATNQFLLNYHLDDPKHDKTSFKVVGNNQKGIALNSGRCLTQLPHSIRSKKSSFLKTTCQSIIFYPGYNTDPFRYVRAYHIALSASQSRTHLGVKVISEKMI